MTPKPKRSPFYVIMGLIALFAVIGGFATKCSSLFFIWPAWFRFRHYFPSVPRPDFWFGVVLSDLFILAVMIREKIVFNKIHPVMLWTGSFIILENLTEVLLFDTYYWRILSGKILELFPS